MKEPQKIFFDGELIGEVPATDNLEKFLEAADFASGFLCE
jgi:hypothetical protein